MCQWRYTRKQIYFTLLFIIDVNMILLIEVFFWECIAPIGKYVRERGHPGDTFRLE
jgi:hypothetical protein